MSSSLILILGLILVSFIAVGIFVTLLVKRILDRGSIPVAVLVDEQVPISLPDAVRIPLDAQLIVAFREVVNIEAVIPIQMDLPLDTVIETSVLGLGTIKIPIKALVPISINVPISSPVTVDARNIPITLRQDIDVRIPDLLLPLKTTIRVGIPVRPQRKNPPY